MKPLVLPSPLPTSPFSLRHRPPRRASPRFPTRFSLHSKTIAADDAAPRAEYKPGVFDDLFLNLFRSKMVKEVGWDSEKPGYDGLIEVAHRLMMKGSSNSDTRDAAVRILRALFPPFLLDLYQLLIAPIGEGKLAAVMVARVTALTCQWLMGKCTVNSVDLLDGTSCQSGVFVERCKYLEEFASILVSFQRSLSSRTTWGFPYSWSQTLKTTAASSSLAFILRSLKRMQPSRSLAWRFVPTPFDGEKSCRTLN